MKRWNLSGVFTLSLSVQQLQTLLEPMRLIVEVWVEVLTKLSQLKSGISYPRPNYSMGYSMGYAHVGSYWTKPDILICSAITQ